jgi:hypothetical protein
LPHSAFRSDRLRSSLWGSHAGSGRRWGEARPIGRWRPVSSGGQPSGRRVDLDLALPLLNVLGQYIFLVDINGHREEEHVAQALERLRKRTGMLKVFGSYPRWQP